MLSLLTMCIHYLTYFHNQPGGLAVSILHLTSVRLNSLPRATQIVNDRISFGFMHPGSLKLFSWPMPFCHCSASVGKILLLLTYEIHQIIWVHYGSRELEAVVLGKC